MPEPEFEPVVGRPKLQYAHVDALLLVVERIEDGDLLLEAPRKTPGTAIHNRARTTGKRLLDVWRVATFGRKITVVFFLHFLLPYMLTNDATSL